MKLVQHPNVVRLYEVIDTQTKLYLILELGDGGDLYDYIMPYRSGLPEEVSNCRQLKNPDSSNQCQTVGFSIVLQQKKNVSTVSSRKTENLII